MGFISSKFRIHISPTKKAIRATAGLDFQAPTNDSFKSLGIVKIHDLYKVQYASLMWDFDHGILPHAFDDFFVPISAIHNYETRSAVAGKLAQPHIFNTKIHGNKMFKRQGVLIFNEIVSKEFYINPTTKMSFLKKFKEYLIGLY